MRVKTQAKIIQSFSSPFSDLSFSQSLRTELIFTATRKSIFPFLLQYFSLEGCFSALPLQKLPQGFVLTSHISEISSLPYQLSCFVRKIPYGVVTFALNITYNTNVKKVHKKHESDFVVYIFLTNLSREWGWQWGGSFICSYTTLIAIQNAIVKIDT